MKKVGSSVKMRSVLDKPVSIDYISFQNQEVIDLAAADSGKVSISVWFVSSEEKQEREGMYVKRGGYGEIRQLNRCKDWLFRFGG